MYVVDGVVQAKGFDASSIDPKDIDSISVLKNESAVGLYGKDAKNGAVIIETKVSKPKASTNLEIGKEQLYIVDGEQLPIGTDISYLSPDDIKSVSVLKAEAAIAIYGEEGKNGVVLISTKDIDTVLGFDRKKLK